MGRAFTLINYTQNLQSTVNPGGGKIPATKTSWYKNEHKTKKNA